MNTRIAKASSKGQITLPAPFRQQQKTDTFLITYYPEKAIITPLKIPTIQENSAEEKGFWSNISGTSLAKDWNSEADNIWDTYESL